MDNNVLLGIDHITAIAGDPQQSLDLYTGVLGLRLVKLTIIFDEPGTSRTVTATVIDGVDL